MKRRNFVAALAAGASVALSGCTGGESGTGTATDGSGGTATSRSETTSGSGPTTGSDTETTTETATSEPTGTGEPATTAAGEPNTTGTGGGSNGSTGSSGSLSVADTEFTPKKECSGSTGANVEFASDGVHLTGCVRGSNGCHVAALEDVAVDGETLRITVTTEAEGDGATACTQQIVQRGYEATVTTNGGSPSTVEVRHDEMGETRTVATAER